MTKTRGFLYLAVFAIFTASLSGDAFAQKVRLRSQITPTCTSNQGGLAKFSDLTGFAREGKHYEWRRIQQYSRNDRARQFSN